MASTTASQTKRSSWGNINSRQFIKNYDKSPLTSPKHTPPQSPSISRNNSTASIDSFKSEPTWASDRHHSNASAASAKPRQDSVASQNSVQSTASHKKGGFMGGLFHKETKEEKEKRKRETPKIVLGSKHAAAVKSKLAVDPAYREFQDKHRKPSVPTAGISGSNHSSHSTAAAQEARHPHSGPPALHGSLDLPTLTRIESHDETDSDEDPAERMRREWNTAPEHNLCDIPEVRSRQSSARASPWASPIHSRETSPDRFVARPGIGSKRSSYGGAYTKDGTGRWKKTPPSMTPILPQHEGVNPDLLAASLAERLNAAS